MVKRTFNKEIIRTITRSWGRFLAIAAIVALGTGFYAGLRMTAPDMRIAADIFYDGTALSDLRVLSTFGLSDADIDMLRGVEGVEAVMPAYETDVMATINKEQYAIRVHSLDTASAQASNTSDGVHAQSDDLNYLNRPLLVEGSWPTRKGECVISADRVMNTPTTIGDRIEITEGTQNVDEVLATRTYTVVGYVHSSYYAASANMGSTTLGSGVLQQFMYVPESDFSHDLPYAEAFLTVKGAADEASSSAAYRQTVAVVKQRLDDAAPSRERARQNEVKQEAKDELDRNRSDFERERTDAQTQLDEAKAKLDDGKAQLANAQIKLDDAAATIASSEASVASGQVEYDNGVAQLAGQRTSAESQLSDASAQLAEKQSQINEADASLAQGELLLQEGWSQWQAGVDQVQVGLAQLALMDPASPEYAALKVRIEGQQAALDATKQQLDVQQATIDAQKAQLGEAHAQLSGAWAQYDIQKQQVYSQLSAAQATLDHAGSQLENGRTELARGRTALADGRAELARKTQEYTDGLDEYQRNKAEADQKFADAEKELVDAQNKIDDIEEPTWYVMDRSKNYGVESFDADAGRVDSIAQVFPFIFFLVAALVALTTMTRMVEEERGLIGTYKALGYSRARITSKYLIYAAAASAIGGIIGIAVFSQILPMVIFKAYVIIYAVPAGPHPLDPGIAGLAFGLGVGVTLVATGAAAGATLREQPAALMLPRAPKAGKRILLERIRPLWHHMSFSWKVTFRNIFRYKKRFIMTVIGIAGCTALLLTGLGLHDAINDIIVKQYGEITKYNVMISLKDDISPESLDRVDAIIDDKEVISSSTVSTRSNMLASTFGHGEVGLQVIAPQDGAALSEFITMRDRTSKEVFSLKGDAVIVTEKLATKLGVSAGDTFKLFEQDAIGNAKGEGYTFTVSNVAENYINNYIYLMPQHYTEVTGKTLTDTVIFAVCSEDHDKRVAFSDDLRAIDGVKTVAYNDETIESYQKMLSSVNMIVVVLVVAAAALAFIVLYNLTNINITERQREIATIKVLGFTPHEVNAYIYRETILLTLIGCAVGLIFGVFMEAFVVTTAEVDQVMFGRVIHVLSFVGAFVWTLLFSILVTIFMRHKLDKIDMVESLKANE
ncbi:MAG: FtsX-like permease family protein [Raoultibacter sp.]